MHQRPVAHPFFLFDSALPLVWNSTVLLLGSLFNKCISIFSKRVNVYSLQGLISRTKDFGDAYESILKKLSQITERFRAADALQPDILAKKSQSDQLKVGLVFSPPSTIDTKEIYACTLN